MLTKLNIPPGVYKNNTPYATGPRWYDANLVRWTGNVMSPIGGWQRMTSTPVTGACRGLFAWLDNSENRYLAIGTSEKLYIYSDGSLVDITPSDFVVGRSYSIFGSGYGAANYGAEEYGTARTAPTALTLQSATWTFDTWGEYLVGCATSDGRILEWTLNKVNDAAAVSGAPEDCQGVLVTEQRHLMAFGASGDKRYLKWSDSEDRNDWTPVSTNQAGDWNLNTPGEILAGIKTRGEILFLTTEDAHVCRFIGAPLVFSFERVGQKCGLMGPNAAVAIEGGVVWMGADSRIYSYDGAVRPVPCEVEDWLENNLYKLGGAQVYAGTLAEQGEAWWFWPSAYGEENTKYLIWNYRNNHWNCGTLTRSAWLDRGAWKNPVAVADDGYVYQHEVGYTNSGTSRTGTVYAETGAIEIGSGDEIAHITQVIPDEKTRGQVSVTFKAAFTPNGVESSHGPYTVRTDGYTDVRLCGRQVKYRIDQVVDDDWRVGNFRAEVKAGGGR
jgi:hypothetical protein